MTISPRQARALKPLLDAHNAALRRIAAADYDRGVCRDGACWTAAWADGLCAKHYRQRRKAQNKKESQ
jgi:hypothetical protein